MKIIRTGIVLGAALLLLPYPPDDNDAVAGAQAQARPDPLAVISAAATAAYDVGSICQREPAVCDTASKVFWHVETRARYGVRLIYQWAQDGGGDGPDRPVGQLSVIADPMPIGSTGAADDAGQALSQSTLRIEDLIPEWRGPARTAGG